MQRVFGLPLLLVLALCAPMFFLGLQWGLPSHASDEFLFHNHELWTGRHILEQAGGWQVDPARGADVSSRPIDQRQLRIPLNDNDQKRARIAIRYRLYSYQPDEMITLRALAGMHPGTGRLGGLDPQLYQYGGLWIYPVGALLKLASTFGLVTLRRDVAFYVDNPEIFGRFYVISRAYSALWGLVGVVAVFAIMRRICGGSIFPSAAAVLFSTMPAIVNASHEAKPHLAGAVLILLAVLAAGTYVQTGKRRFAMLCGLLCGAATGMVLSGYCAFLILPAMVAMRRPATGGRAIDDLVRSVACGIGVYFVTNPYVALNLIWNRQVLASNLGNTAAMYHANVSVESLWNGVRLIAAGSTPLVAVIGAMGAVGLGMRAFRVRHSQDPIEVRRRATGVLLGIPAVWLAIQFFAFAGDKPGEYGRFALYLDIVLVIEALAGVATFIGGIHPERVRVEETIGPDEQFQDREDRENAEFLQVLIVAMMMLGCGLQSFWYLRGFVIDSGSQTSRVAAARELRSMAARARLNLLQPTELPVMVVDSEPAPYCLPPVSLFDWQIELLPKGRPARESAGRDQAWVVPVDVSGDDEWAWLRSTQLSWADKPFEIGSGPALVH